MLAEPPDLERPANTTKQTGNIMTPINRGFAALGVAGLLLALTACGTKGGASDYDPNAESPLGAYYTQIYGDSDEDWAAEMESQNEQIEELTAACMTEAGFEYIPNTDNGGMVMMDESDWEDRNTLEYRETHGYDVFYNPETEPEPTDNESEYVDPNQDYIESLGDTGAEAYYLALYGPMPTEDEEWTEEEWAASSADSCSGKAQAEVWGDQMGASEDNEFADLEQAMMDLNSSLYPYDGGTATNPEMAALDQKWSSCMADAGFDFTNEWAAQQSFYDRSNAIWEEYATDPETGEISDEDGAEQARSDAFKEEVDTAVAGFKCNEKLNYQAESQKIQFAAEQVFVDEHKAELDAWVEAQKAALAEDK